MHNKSTLIKSQCKEKNTVHLYIKLDNIWALFQFTVDVSTTMPSRERYSPGMCQGDHKLNDHRKSDSILGLYKTSRNLTIKFHGKEFRGTPIEAQTSSYSREQIENIYYNITAGTKQVQSN